MDWVPIVFITFKVAVFGTGMFFAIKWHYDQGKKVKEEASRLQTPSERTPGASE
jgi:preprotein translocase subunit SecY